MWIVIDWKTFNAELYIDKGHVMVLGCDDSWGIWFAMKSSGRISISWGSQGRLTVLHTVGTFLRLPRTSVCVSDDSWWRGRDVNTAFNVCLFLMCTNILLVFEFITDIQLQMYFFSIMRTNKRIRWGQHVSFVYFCAPYDLQPPEGTEVRSLLAGRVPLFLRTAAAIHWVMEK